MRGDLHVRFGGRGISRPYYHYAFAMLLGSTLFVTFPSFSRKYDREVRYRRGRMIKSHLFAQVKRVWQNDCQYPDSTAFLTMPIPEAKAENSHRPHWYPRYWRSLEKALREITYERAVRKGRVNDGETETFVSASEKKGLCKVVTRFWIIVGVEAGVGIESWWGNGNIRRSRFKMSELLRSRSCWKS
jgi:hypothetical protein